MRFCTKCGNQISDTAVFCNKCGNKIEPDVEQDTCDDKIDPTEVEPEKKIDYVEPQNKKNSKNQKLILVIAIAVSMIVIVGVAVVLISKRNNNSSPNDVVEITTRSVEESTEVVKVTEATKKVETTYDEIDESTEAEPNRDFEKFIGSWTSTNCRDLNIELDGDCLKVIFEEDGFNEETGVEYNYYCRTCHIEGDKLVYDNRQYPEYQIDVDDNNIRDNTHPDAHGYYIVADNYDEAYKKIPESGYRAYFYGSEYPFDNSQLPVLVQANWEDVYKNYSDEEICELARVHFILNNNPEVPIKAEITYSGANTITVKLYEETVSNVDTHYWYYIDRGTGKGTDWYGNSVDLTEVEGMSIDENRYANTDSTEDYNFTSAMLLGDFSESDNTYDVNARVWLGDLQANLPEEEYHDTTISISKACIVNWYNDIDDIETVSIEWWMENGTESMFSVKRDSNGIITSFSDGWF